MLRKALCLGAVGAGAGAVYLSRDATPTTLWSIEPEFTSVGGGVEGTRVVCRLMPNGLTCARYEVPMGEGVWQWEAVVEGDETEIGVCGALATLHFIARTRTDHETWRTLSRDWKHYPANLARLETPLPKHLVFTLDCAARELVVTAKREGVENAEVAAFKETLRVNRGPNHVVVRFDRPAAVTFTQLPKQIRAA